MNPFSNNVPNLTASERIRDRRDSTIYHAEKQRFQNQKTCGNKNVKYYNNGTVRSAESYKIQASLSRGNVLCNDCDNKGLLCSGPSSKDDLASIRMGNNIVSEYWGGADVKSAVIDNTDCFSVVSIKGKTILDVSFNVLGVANLDGSGVIIDPSNVLFPSELCDPLRYLQKTNLKTNIVLTANIPWTGGNMVCTDPAKNTLIDSNVDISGNGNHISGVIKCVCCVGDALFDIHIELFYVSDYSYLGSILNYNPALGWPNITATISNVTILSTILGAQIFKVGITQGTYTHNQTRNNATEQSYMSCLEYGTKKINFTK